MAKNPYDFPFKPTSDWVVIDRLDIQSNEQKRAKKADIIIADASGAPKSIQDIEMAKARELASYQNTKKEMLRMWDEHPNQGIIKAIGPGKIVDEGDPVPMELKTGQKVYYRGQTGEPIIINKKLYWMVKEYDIFGIVP